MKSPGATLLRLGLPDALSGIGGLARPQPADDRPGYLGNMPEILLLRRYELSLPWVRLPLHDRRPCAPASGPFSPRPHIDNPAHRLPNSVTNSVSDNRNMAWSGCSGTTKVST